MSQKRWKQVSEIFQAALEQPPDGRKSFLREASKGDTELLEAVERLLEADSEASEFMEQPLVCVKKDSEES